MQIHIFTEGSNTTADSTDAKLRDYYHGLFREVRSLEKDLSKYGNTELHIVSEQFGIANGDERAESVINKKVEKPLKAVQNELLSAADDEVIVILFSASVFKQTVTEIWTDLVERAEDGGIWCFGAAQSALRSIPLEQLEDSGCSLITYQRVGVARMNKDTREKLLKLLGETEETKS